MSIRKLIYLGDDGLYYEMTAEDTIVGYSKPSYVHIQTESSAKWVVQHRLGYKPSVTIIDAVGDELWADILHIDDNILEINMDESYSGKVYCS